MSGSDGVDHGAVAGRRRGEDGRLRGRFGAVGPAIRRLGAELITLDKRLAKARAAAEGLRAASKGQTLGGLSMKDLITEGRR